jgi:hypothetical protein
MDYHPAPWGVLDDAADEIERLRAHIHELQENGDRLREIADAAVRDQRDMIDAATDPLWDEIHTLRDALASKSAPGIDASAGCVEPVAWINPDSLAFLHAAGSREASANVWIYRAQSVGVVPLYAATQQRQPLTDEQILEIGVECGVIEENWSEAEIEFARAVEAAHGIKETK